MFDRIGRLVVRCLLELAICLGVELLSRPPAQRRTIH